MKNPDKLVLSIYEAGVENACKRMIERLSELLEKIRAHPLELDVGIAAYGAQEIFRIRLAYGQNLGAALKNALAARMIADLRTAVEQGFDVTPTVAKNVMKLATGGKAIAWKPLLQEFGTPGRTAANKAPPPPDEVVELVRAGVDRVLPKFEPIRLSVCKTYKPEADRLLKQIRVEKQIKDLATRIANR